jgi:protein-disulfide isomerase
VSSEDPQWGSATAPVTVVIFSDFECPFCARATSTIGELAKSYGAEKLRLVWKNAPLPFHQKARPTHDAAMAVFEVGGDAAFWRFHDLAFAHHEDLSPENHERWATQAGVEVAAFRAALASGRARAKVDRDLALGERIGVRGTPNFRVNGVEISGAQPASAFKAVIDAELPRAADLVARGVPAARVYFERVRSNVQALPSAEAAQGPSGDDEADEDRTIHRIPVSATDPVRGPADALVTIVLFSDFQCPFCKRVEPTLAQLLATYPKDVRIVWKDNPLPFHDRARPAASLARLAFERRGNAGFWQAHDALFDSQSDLTDAGLEAVAKKVPLPWRDVKAAIEKDSFAKVFAASADLAADFNARGTPHAFINGYRVQGAQPFEAFDVVVKAQLERASQLVQGGVPRGQVYAELMKTAAPPAPPETVAAVPALPADAPARGPARAPVVLQLFSDFQCPFCKRIEPTFAELRRRYPNELKIVWRNLPLPFHKDAELAAEAAFEAQRQKGDAGFWRYHDALFAAQGERGLERPVLEAIAAEQKLNVDEFRAALDSHRHLERVRRDAQAAEAAGVQGTPGSVVGRYYVSGAQPVRAFVRAVEAALMDARGAAPKAAGPKRAP